MKTAGVDGLQHPLDLLAQVGTTLSASHYLHRDINARNILVSGAATDPTAWHCIGGAPSPRGHVFTLIDFGSAVDLRASRRRGTCSIASSSTVSRLLSWFLRCSSRESG